MGGLRRIGDVVVIRLSELDSNIYMMGDTVIDSGTGFNFTRLYQALKILKMSIGEVKQIINTHAHFDHIGGNGYFVDAKISIHEDDAPIVEKGDQKMSYADYFDGKLSPREVHTKLKEGDTVDAGSMELEVIHTPGHTKGSICLYDKSSKTLFTGDTVFSDGIGRTDMPGGNDAELNKSIEKISSLDVRRLFPGHGEPLVLDEPKKLGEIISAPLLPEPEEETGPDEDEPEDDDEEDD
jgi:hydroxyacylglutathione hydrolase